MLKSGNRILSCFAGLRVSGKPVRSFVLNNNRYCIVVLALLLFPDDDMVRGHAVAEVHGLYVFAALR